MRKAKNQSHRKQAFTVLITWIVTGLIIGLCIWYFQTITPSNYMRDSYPFPEGDFTDSIKPWVGFKQIERPPGTREVFKISDDIEIAMRWVPPGSFIMGSPYPEQPSWDQDDEYQMWVALSNGYWLAETETTQKLWQAVTGENPSKYHGENLPVESISWDDIQVFLKKLNQLSHITFRLPTEAEWEYACRAGTTTPYHFGHEINLDKVWYGGANGRAEETNTVWPIQTRDVEKGLSNPWGLKQMHGNVWEWCQSRHGRYGGDHQLDPGSPTYGRNRMMRGGSFDSYGENCRSANRESSLSSKRFSDVGFRLRADQFAVNADLIHPYVPRIHASQDDLMPGTRKIVKVSDGVEIAMRWIPPGRFGRGSPADEPGRSRFERQYVVTLSEGFWLAETETSQKLWLSVMAENPSHFQGEDLPVENMTPSEQGRFIRELNALGKNVFRLPTEIEWEFACRAGTTTPFYFGDQITPEQANFDGSEPYSGSEKSAGRGKTVDVDSMSGNAWGLKHMHGNVWEYCKDSGSYVEEINPFSKWSRVVVVRGGSWASGAGQCRSASRDFLPRGPSNRIGFRLAMDHSSLVELAEE